MDKFLRHFCSFAAGAFFISTIQGLADSDIYMWLPCMFLTLLALVCACGVEEE